MTDRTQWLSASEAEAWLGLVAVMELLPATLDSQLHRDADLTFFDYFTMAQLAEAPDRTMRISDLAEQTNASVPRLSRVVARLEGDGYIERRSNASDGRSRHACLTEAGMQKLAAAGPGHIDTVRASFADVLSPTQLTQLDRICRRLLENLDPQRRMLAETVRGARGRAGLSRPVGTPRTTTDDDTDQASSGQHEQSSA